MSTTTKAEQARTIIASLTVNLYNAITIEAMLSRANDDPALREAYDHTYEVHGFNVIHHTLIDQLIMTLMRMHDPGRSNEASLHRIFGLLDDKDVMAVFRAEARGWQADMLDLADSNEQSIVDAVHDSRSRWAEITAGAPIKRLREYRNRHLAHSLIEKPETDSPTSHCTPPTLGVKNMRLLPAHSRAITTVREGIFSKSA